MKKVASLEDLYIDGLKDVLNAENQIIKALPKMIKAASSQELKSAFEEHLSQTEGQVERLEQIFELLDKPARGKKCAAMEGLITEAKELMEEDMEPMTLDAALIAAAQKVEHYEIGTYGTLRTWANLLGYEGQARLLEETLNEEKQTDDNLTQIAENSINLESAEEPVGVGFSTNGFSSNGHARSSRNGRSGRSASSSKGSR